MKNVNVFVFIVALVQTYLLFSNLIKLTFHPWHLLIHESFTTREVSFEYNTQKLGNALTLFPNLEESGTGIRHVVGLSLMGDMPTNKARMSDNAQQQSASNAVPILLCFIVLFHTIFVI